MRAVAVHPEVVVATSRLWQTTATAIRAPEAEPGEEREAFLVDSPYFPDELELLRGLLERSGFQVRGLLATHADFDHLLGRLAFPDLTLGVGESTLARIRAEPGAAQRELRDADAEHYVERPSPLALGGIQALPVPGELELGRERIELHPGEGHTGDGMAVVAPFAGVLVCGDYLSDVEIPTIAAGGSLAGYRATLDRLRRLLESVAVLVPGHGSPLDPRRALELLDEDVSYLDALEAGEERPSLPPGRNSRRQRELHAANLRAVG